MSGERGQFLQSERTRRLPATNTGSRGPDSSALFLLSGLLQGQTGNKERGQARKVGYSVRKEFSFGRLLSEANEVLLRGAAAVATADADAGVPDEQLDGEARQARQAAAQAVARAQAILGADAHRLRSSRGSARGMRADLGLQRLPAKAHVGPAGSALPPLPKAFHGQTGHACIH